MSESKKLSIVSLGFLGMFMVCASSSTVFVNLWTAKDALLKNVWRFSLSTIFAFPLFVYEIALYG
jgi:hypothetical protein